MSKQTHIPDSIPTLDQDIWTDIPNSIPILDQNVCIETSYSKHENTSHYLYSITHDDGEPCQHSGKSKIINVSSPEDKKR